MSAAAPETPLNYSDGDPDLLHVQLRTVVTQTQGFRAGSSVPEADPVTFLEQFWANGRQVDHESTSLGLSLSCMGKNPVNKCLMFLPVLDGGFPRIPSGFSSS